MVNGTKQLLSSKSADMHIAIAGSKLDLVTLYKYLGLATDQHIDWSEQIDTICKTISQRLAVLHRIRYLFSDGTWKLLYNALILIIVMFSLTTAMPCV